MNNGRSDKKLGMAWIALTLALALHVTDEALTGFLAIYNPTVIAMRQRFTWFPMPVFEFWPWLTGLMALVCLLLLLSPLVLRGARWLRPFAYFFSAIMILNALGHTVATVFGQTVGAVRFARPAPGFYSSPVLFAAAVYLLIQLRRTSAKTIP